MVQLFCRMVISLICDRTSPALTSPSRTWAMRSRRLASSERSMSCIWIRCRLVARPDRVYAAAAGRVARRGRTASSHTRVLLSLVPSSGVGSTPSVSGAASLTAAA